MNSCRTSIPRKRRGKQTNVLVRFRKDFVAVQGDVQAMFHQVKVPINHHDLFRFLWWEDGDVKKQMIECRMTVYIFGTRPQVPQILI